jgi:hypothetical protein
VNILLHQQLQLAPHLPIHPQLQPGMLLLLLLPLLLQ